MWWCDFAITAAVQLDAILYVAVSTIDHELGSSTPPSIVTHDPVDETSREPLI